MVHYRGTSGHIDRPVTEVFELVGTYAFEDYPQGDEEVVEFRRLSPRPVGVSRAIMMRNERGKREEVDYEVVGFDCV